jgi:hypothetical protein
MTDNAKPKRPMGRPRVFGQRDAMTIRVDKSSAQALRELSGEMGMPITAILAQAIQSIIANRQ